MAKQSVSTTPSEVGSTVPTQQQSLTKRSSARYRDFSRPSKLRPVPIYIADAEGLFEKLDNLCASMEEVETADSEMHLVRSVKQVLLALHGKQRHSELFE